MGSSSESVVEPIVGRPDPFSFDVPSPKIAGSEWVRASAKCVAFTVLCGIKFPNGSVVAVNLAVVVRVTQVCTVNEGHVRSLGQKGINQTAGVLQKQKHTCHHSSLVPHH